MNTVIKKRRAKKVSLPKTLTVEMPRVMAGRWPPKNCEEIGRGGEAVVYRLNQSIVAKVFLNNKAPEYKDDEQLQEASKMRIEEMQEKLFDFPQGLPQQLVIPNGVLVRKNKEVFGYTMPMIEGVSLEKLTRTDSILTPAMLRNLLYSLHDLVTELHSKGVVIGDFNESNVIVKDSMPYLIDADSMQFGRWQCRCFMPRFVDPEILGFKKGKAVVNIPQVKKSTKGCNCDECVAQRERVFQEQKKLREEMIEQAKKNLPLEFTMVKGHSQQGDWYSFLVIAMRLITFTDPYGGVLPGKDLVERIKERITVFNPNVVYPLVAKPLATVPRPILEMFFKAFHLGERFVPPRELFNSLVAS